MAPLPPRPGHRLLRCPICRRGFHTRSSALVCGNGHNFDLAREGYVNLLPGNRRRPAAGGDGPEQLRHRNAFLGAGHFGVIAAEIAERLRHGGIASVGGRNVLDAAAGRGHHLPAHRRWARPGDDRPRVGHLGGRRAPRRAPLAWPSPSPICGRSGRCAMPRSTSSSTFSRRGISPRRRGCSGREAGSRWSIRKPTI